MVRKTCLAFEASSFTSVNPAVHCGCQLRTRKKASEVERTWKEEVRWREAKDKRLVWEERMETSSTSETLGKLEGSHGVWNKTSGQSTNVQSEGRTV